MANSAFNHSPSITIPGAGNSTNDAIVLWNGTAGDNFSNSTIIVGATTMGLAADTNLLTFGNGTLAIAGTVTGISTITATTFSGALSGNATSATSAATLTTARAIGGVNFNGSAAINLPGVNTAGDQNTSGTAAGLSATLVVASGGTGLASHTAGDMLYYASGTTLTRIAKGTADQVLTMNDGATAPQWETLSAGGDFTNGGDNGALVLGTNDSNTLTFETNNTARMVIAAGGDVSIKSTNKLHFGDGTDTYTSQIADDQLATWVGGRHMFQIRGGGVFFGWDTGNNTDTTYASQFTAQALPNEPSGAGLGGVHIHQGTSDDAVLQFSSSDVGHGITSWVNTAIYGLFKKNNATYGGLYFQTYSGANTADCYYHLAAVTEDNQTKSTSGRAAITFDSRKKSSTSLGAMATNSNIVKISTEDTTRFLFDKEGSGHADVEWTTYSDGRLKSNQVVVPYGLAEVMQLQPKIYDRDSGYIDEITGEVVLEGNVKRQIGFVAQEVKTIIPEVVKDVDALSLYSLDDGKLMAVVVKAIQELNAKVDALQG